ncbi:NAD(P)/FAD-dependent oxidoreductase [Sphingomonas crusticola]|uniref:NAD(P)/FAD-dependent oxidoreductase n=1 Tax=Sphingomonas crusticola TaxID=1697973 RepID=UPI000E25FDD1|nr:NAD(P)/FAD-dependent oxidoreductase [Sphingomonas crusticola]
MAEEPLDCLIVGAGPAGLTAAIYLARFHLDIRVVDAGNSRAGLIPKTRNHAGFPEGISGPNLLRRMNQQARIYGARIEEGEVTAIARDDDLFHISTSDGEVVARSILLATGVVNIRPEMRAEVHDQALARGLIRYCPICDAYEVTDLPVGVIGSGEHGVREAIFLRGYTADLALIAPAGPHELDDAQRALLEQAGIAAIDGPAHNFQLAADHIQVDTAAGTRSFASIYPALGSVIRSELARSLGAEASDEGCLVVDDHQRTSIAGLYAAGDVVKGLDQISHAMGEGGVAATTIRNDLARRHPFMR